MKHVDKHQTTQDTHTQKIRSQDKAGKQNKNIHRSKPKYYSRSSFTMEKLLA